MKMVGHNPHRPMPEGIVFCGRGPLQDTTKDLCNIAAFLQSLMVFTSNVLVRYDDWWEHDDLHFTKGRTDIHELFALLESPRHLLESMPGEDHVFIGLGPPDESWYLRVYADWDDRNEVLVAAYAIAFVESLAQRFREDTLSKLSCFEQELSSTAYFERICDGECSL